MFIVTEYAALKNKNFCAKTLIYVFEKENSLFFQTEITQDTAVIVCVFTTEGEKNIQLFMIKE